MGRVASCDMGSRVQAPANSAQPSAVKRKIGGLPRAAPALRVENGSPGKAQRASRLNTRRTGAYHVHERYFSPVERDGDFPQLRLVVRAPHTPLPLRHLSVCILRRRPEAQVQPLEHAPHQNQRQQPPEEDRWAFRQIPPEIILRRLPLRARWPLHVLDHEGRVMVCWRLHAAQTRALPRCGPTPAVSPGTPATPPPFACSPPERGSQAAPSGIGSQVARQRARASKVQE